MKEVKILINKSAQLKINNLPKKERECILDQLSIINNSANPILYSYSTVTSKIGDLMFIINNHFLSARVSGENIEVFNIIS